MGVSVCAACTGEFQVVELAYAVHRWSSHTIFSSDVKLCLAGGAQRMEVSHFGLSARVDDGLVEMQKSLDKVGSVCAD